MVPVTVRMQQGTFTFKSKNGCGFMISLEIWVGKCCSDLRKYYSSRNTRDGGQAFPGKHVSAEAEDLICCCSYSQRESRVSAFSEDQPSCCRRGAWKQRASHCSLTLSPCTDRGHSHWKHDSLRSLSTCNLHGQ